MKIHIYKFGNSLCGKCPNTEFFPVSIFPYSVRMRENTNQKNSVFWYFSRSGFYMNQGLGFGANLEKSSSFSNQTSYKKKLIKLKAHHLRCLWESSTFY